MKSRKAAWEAQVRAEELTASKDVELQKLLQDTSHESDPFSGSGATGPDYGAIAALYAKRYPYAGIRWIASLNPPQNPGLLSSFGKAWYAADPQAAIGMLVQLRMEERAQLAGGLCQVASAADRDRLWDMMRKGELNVREPIGLQARLIANQARSDPDGAWQTASERIGGGYDESAFLRTLSNLEPQTPYPAAFLDHVAPDQLNEVINTGLHASRSRENVEPLARWLAEQPPSPALEEAYQDMSAWETAYGDVEKAKGWVDRISDPIRRESAMGQLPHGVPR